MISTGTHVVEKCQVTRIIVHNQRAVAVETTKGIIECDYVINTGGLWARNVGQLTEPHVKVPVHPAEHYFLYTYPIEEIDPQMPGNYIFFKCNAHD